MFRRTLLAAVLLAFTAQAQPTGRLRVGVEGNYPPFSQLGADGTLSGFDVDFANAVCTELKVTCQLVQQEFDGMIPALNARKFDAIGEEAFIPAVDVEEAGVFVLQRLERQGWGIEGGARFDTRRLRTESDERRFSNASLAAGVFARPSDAWFLALSLGHNRRSPTELELFANGPFSTAATNRPPWSAQVTLGATAANTPWGGSRTQVCTAYEWTK